MKRRGESKGQVADKEAAGQYCSVLQPTPAPDLCIKLCFYVFSVQGCLLFSLCVCVSKHEAGLHRKYNVSASGMPKD